MALEPHTEECQQRTWEKGIQVIGYLEKLIMTCAQVKERTLKACQASKVVADKQET